jgi:hypothetical protein
LTGKQNLWQSDYIHPKTLSWHWPHSRRNTGRFRSGMVAAFTSVRLAFFTGIRNHSLCRLEAQAFHMVPMQRLETEGLRKREKMYKTNGGEDRQRGVSFNRNRILLLLSIHVVMATDVKQVDFLIRNQDGQGESVAARDADCLHTKKFAAKVVVSKVRLKRIALQIIENRNEFFPQVRVLLEEFSGGAGKTGRPDESVHASAFHV